MGQFHGPWRVLDVRRGIQQLEDALASGDGFLEDVVYLRQAVDGLVEGSDVGEKGDQRAQRQLAAHDHHRSYPQHDDRAQRGHEAHGREERGPVANAPHSFSIVVLAFGGEAFQFPLLLAEGLDDPDAREAVLQPGVDVAQPVAHTAVDGADAGVEAAQGHGEDGHRQQHGQRQSPVQQEEDDGRAEQPQEVHGRQGRAMGHEVLQGVDVVGHAGHQFAGGGALEEGEGQPLQVAVEAHPQVEDEALAQRVADVQVTGVGQLLQRVHADQ